MARLEGKSSALWGSCRSSQRHNRRAGIHLREAIAWYSSALCIATETHVLGSGACVCAQSAGARGRRRVRTCSVRGTADFNGGKRPYEPRITITSRRKVSFGSWLPALASSGDGVRPRRARALQEAVQRFMMAHLSRAPSRK